MGLQLIPPDINIDFVGKRYIFVALSTAINLVAIALLIFVGLNYGVDFVGGSVVQLKFEKSTNGDEIRKALAPMDLAKFPYRISAPRTKTVSSSASRKLRTSVAWASNSRTLSMRAMATPTRPKCCASKR